MRRIISVFFAAIALSAGMAFILGILATVSMLLQHKPMNDPSHWILLIILFFIAGAMSFLCKILWQVPRISDPGTWNGYHGEGFSRPRIVGLLIMIVILTPLLVAFLFFLVSQIFSEISGMGTDQTNELAPLWIRASLACLLILSVILSVPVIVYLLRSRGSPLAVLTREGICLPFVVPEFINWHDIKEIQVNHYHRSYKWLEFILNEGVLPTDRRISRWHQVRSNSVRIPVDSAVHPLISASREAHSSAFTKRTLAQNEPLPSP